MLKSDPASCHPATILPGGNRNPLEGYRGVLGSGSRGPSPRWRRQPPADLDLPAHLPSFKEWAALLNWLSVKAKRQPYYDERANAGRRRPTPFW